MSNKFVSRFGTLVATLGVAAAANAQLNAWDFCVDPATTDPIAGGSSTTSPFALTNGIWGVLIGTSGSYGFGPASPCAGDLIDNDTLPIAGSFSFFTFNGSALSANDDFYAVTPGIINNINQTVPVNVVIVGAQRYSHFSIRSESEDGTDLQTGIFGESTLGAAQLASYRQVRCSATTAGNVQTQLVVQCVGASMKFSFTMRNTGADPRRIGLRWLHAMRFRSGSETGFPPFTPGKVPFVVTPKGRPVILEKEWSFAQNPGTFPAFFDFYYGQSFVYPSMHISTKKDTQHPDATQVSRVVIGAEPTDPWDMPVADDIFHNGWMGLYFDPVLVQPNGTRTVVFYVEPGQFKVDPRNPYALTTETEPIVGFDGFGQNSLSPNPFRVVSYLDNQYAAQNPSPIPLPTVDLTISFQAGSGLQLAPGEIATKTENNVAANEQRQIEWQVESDGLTPGTYTYSILAEPWTHQVGDPNRRRFSSTKTITGTITIGLTDRIDLKGNFYNAALVGLPWLFGDPTLANLGFPGGSQFYTYDNTSGYQLVTSAERGKGYWVKYAGDPAPFQLNGAFSAGDKTTGDFVFDLHRGWNLISNPYPYPVQLNQLVGVNDADPGTAYSWAELASRNWVRSTWFKFNQGAAASGDPQYFFSSDDSQLIVPGVGYWVYVVTYDNVTLFWPPSYIPGLANAPFTPGGGAPEGGWKVNVNVTGTNGSDNLATMGYAPNANEAASLTTTRPPAFPGSNAAVEANFVRSTTGAQTPWAQDYRTGEGTTIQKYTLVVKMNRSGSYTLTWPEVANLPKNVQLRIKDMLTGQVRLMTATGSLTVSSALGNTRRFEITATTN